MFNAHIELVRKAQVGDLAAWQSLLAAIYPQALRQARALLRDRDLAEDAVQNALLKIYSHLDTLAGPEAFSAWWRRILTNEVYLILRLKQRENQSFGEGNLSQEILPQSGPALDELVALRSQLTRALQNLPFEQQQIVIEVDLWGRSLQEMAELNGLPLGTVKSRLFRAREKLQHELEEFRQGRKEKGAMNEHSGHRNLSEQFYDYLEGTMDAKERAQFETEFLQHPEWSGELKRHKDFITLLHTLTGKLTLSAAEVVAKIQAVLEQVRDYEQIVDDTYFEQGVPYTAASHMWFRAPDVFRVESSHPVMGKAIIIVKGTEAISYLVGMKEAAKIRMSEEFQEQMGLNFADSLKKLAADKSSRLLGTEYLNGRPALHLQFNETVKGKGDMVTHLWMDKDTWMPLATEWYNADGEPARRRVVREVRLNQGLADALFELKLPPEVQVKDTTHEPVQALEEIALAEAKARLGGQVYVAEAAPTGEAYQAKHQWMAMPKGEGVLLTEYSIPGEPLAQLTLTQGRTAHANIPAQMATIPVRFVFDGVEVEGTLIELGRPMQIRGMLEWNHMGRYYTAGGGFEREGLLDVVRKLTLA